MSKFYLLTGVLCILLCAPPEVSAQGKVTKVLTLDEMFHLAAENSKQLKLSKTGIETAKRATDVAKNARLPVIDASLSFSYLATVLLWTGSLQT